MRIPDNWDKFLKKLDEKKGETQWRFETRRGFGFKIVQINRVPANGRRVHGIEFSSDPPHHNPSQNTTHGNLYLRKRTFEHFNLVGKFNNGISLSGLCEGSYWWGVFNKLKNI